MIKTTAALIALSMLAVGPYAYGNGGNHVPECDCAGERTSASVSSPARLTASGGACTAGLVWSSPNYDYMKIGQTRYLPVNTEGNCVSQIPPPAFDHDISALADTTFMSQPHEIEYSLRFDLNTLQALS